MSRLLAFALALLAGAAMAQAYPTKPVRILVPAQPGGGLDLVGRTIAAELSRALSQSFFVENSSGGGGAIAAQLTARAAPDGYTLMVGYVATHAINPALRKVPYDPVKDFTPIAMVGGTRNVLVLHPSLPMADLKTFVDYARAQPGSVNYGTGGPGTLTHLALEQFRGMAKLEMVYAHYRGIAPAIKDMFASQIHVLVPGLAAAIPYIRSGKLKPIAVTGLERHPAIPDVPTFQESGYPGFDRLQWYGIVAPASLPAEITTRLNAEINRAIASPALRERLAREAIDPMPMTPAEFGAYLQADIAAWSAFARERNLRLDD